jgi:hypothetical protein
MAWKYVVLSNGTFEFPIIFPDKMVHADVAKYMKHYLNHDFVTNDNYWGVVSAGMIDDILPENVHGMSGTLNVSSRPQDKPMIETYAYLHGIVGSV